MTIITIVVALLSVLLSITIHEAVHAYVGYALGDDTAKHEGRLTLNPIAHIDPVTTVALPVFLAVTGLPIFGAAKPVPFNPDRLRGGDFGAAAVAVAGPLSNLLLAALAALAYVSLAPTGITAYALQTFLVVNVGFFIFNMIPFPPLDGSRFLYAVAPEPVRALMRSIEALGFMAIIIFIVIFYSFLTPFFAQAMNSVVSFLTGGGLQIYR